jgi:nitroreductase
MKTGFLFLALAALGLAACTTTPEERGPFHEYLHQHGLE